MKKTHFIVPMLVIVFFQQCSNASLTAEKILTNSINYHDPNGLWSDLTIKLLFDEVQPGDSIPVTRKTQVWIDNRKGYFKINRGDKEIHGMQMDSCFIEKGDVTCERAVRLRNYYVYLWGLPMKLKDPGTTLNPVVSDTIWQEVPVYKLRVAYETDDWSYYFGKEKFELRGYSFVKHDGSGEHIYLSSEIECGGIRIPKERSWYTLKGKFLGTDILTSSQPFL